MTTGALLLGALLLLVGLATGFTAGVRLVRRRPDADGPLTAVLAPAAAALGRVEQQLHATERDRIASHAALREQVGALHRMSAELSAQTRSLVDSLRSPTVRGRWGEVQLQRVVELAGMVEHCDFDTQVTVRGEDGWARPDLVVHLAGGRDVPVDAKVPLAAWLQASTEPDPDRRRALLGQHARALRRHVDALAAKSYWQRFDRAVEFVVLFVPGEALVDAAGAADPGLADYAFSRRVVIATPSSLIALLRTVAFSWRQYRLSESAEQIHLAGRDLYRRLATFAGHLDKVGAALGRASGAYNDAVRTLDGRVLVAARRLADLGVSADPLPSPRPAAGPTAWSASIADPTEPAGVASAPGRDATAADPADWPAGPPGGATVAG